MFRKKIGTGLAVLALGAVGAVPAVSAHGPEPHKELGVEMIPVDLFYANFDAGLLLFTGLTPEDFCNGVAPPLAPARVSERHDGTLRIRANNIRDIDLFLYEYDGDPFELTDEICEAVSDDDPTTQPQQPIASGTGHVNMRIAGLDDLDDFGGIRIVNTSQGRLVATDGTQWKVRGHANVYLDEDSIPVGDPANFQNLRVRQLP